MLLVDHAWRVTLEITDWRGGERASDSTQHYFLAKVCSDNLGMFGGSNQVTWHPVLLETKVTDASAAPEGMNCIINKWVTPRGVDTVGSRFMLKLLHLIFCCIRWIWRLVCCRWLTVWNWGSWRGRGCWDRNGGSCAGRNRSSVDSQRACWSRNRLGLGAVIFCLDPDQGKPRLGGTG